MGKISQLGFGIMRIPMENGNVEYPSRCKKMMDTYMKGDFCYFDVHPGYLLGRSQNVLKEYIVDRYPRESYYVTNKMPYYGISSYRDYEITFATELATCGLEYFDYYMLHALSKDVYNMHKSLGGFQFLQEQKQKGLVKNIGISFHDKPEVLEDILSKHPELDFVQLQINFFDWESAVICSKECYDIAKKYNKKIFVMEPIKGGSLAKKIKLGQDALDAATMARISLEFVASLDVDVILSGMTEEEHVLENRISIDRGNTCGYDADKLNRILSQFKLLNKIQCTQCRYCVKECPKGIHIPDIISLLNTITLTGKNDITAKTRYQIFSKNYIKDEHSAKQCIGCRKCEKRCPQKLPISQLMSKAAKINEDMNSVHHGYTVERNCQILIYLLKAHGIKKIVVSPGATNMTFVYSVQQDDYFELYSAVDERSAAYMACGLAEQSGEVVALSCTGATASRNYLPALTEAYYRKLPILAITSSQPSERIGHNFPQVTDRLHPMSDVAKLSVTLPMIHCNEDEWSCEVKANEAILELRHRGDGPVHINLITNYSAEYSVQKLPEARVIRRISGKETMPVLPQTAKKIGIYCGAHKKWSNDLKNAVEEFCRKYDAVVLYDLTSNYKGSYGVSAPLVLKQDVAVSGLGSFDVLIHIGDVSGAYANPTAEEVWRVNEDGVIRDTFGKMTYIFEMSEADFFASYADRLDTDSSLQQVNAWKKQYDALNEKIDELPLSNVWLAQQTADRLPVNSVLHLGILNSLRSWNYFTVPEEVMVYSNTGGFGIDGCVSTVVGAAINDPKKIYYGVLGDLAMFYDLNSLGNRMISSNLRLMVINNGRGVEFTLPHTIGKKMGSGETGEYVAAAGHFGNQSRSLLKNYAIDLGFQYYKVESKEEYLAVLPELVRSDITDRPLIVEVFVKEEDDSDAIRIISELNGKIQAQKVQRKIAVPKRIKALTNRDKVILWGVGNCFYQNISAVEQKAEVLAVCDNNQSKWGTEILPGIKCISPKELTSYPDTMVIIMIENAAISLQIANQLLDMGVTCFDNVYNWMAYEE